MVTCRVQVADEIIELLGHLRGDLWVEFEFSARVWLPGRDGSWGEAGGVYVQVADDWVMVPF